MRPTITRSRAQVPPPGAIPADDFIHYFSVLMENMASTATNNKAVLEQLVTTTTTQYATIKARKSRRFWVDNSGRSPGRNHRPDGDDMRKLKKRNATLQHVILKGWAKRGFCSIHVHGVPVGHDNCNCPKRKPGYVDSATRENPAGPAHY